MRVEILKDENMCTLEHRIERISLQGKKIKDIKFAVTAQFGGETYYAMIIYGD